METSLKCRCKYMYHSVYENITAASRLSVHLSTECQHRHLQRQQPCSSMVGKFDQRLQACLTCPTILDIQPATDCFPRPYASSCPANNN